MTAQRIVRTFVVLALLAMPAVAGANLVTNPGFETGDITGWSNSGAVFVPCDAALAHSGSCVLVLPTQSSAPTALTQSIATVAGGSYDLDFWFRHVESNPSTTFSVSWDGNVIFTEVGGPSTAYTDPAFANLIATTGTTLLEFKVLSTGFFNYFLDDITLTASAASAPEPGTLVLLALGVGGVGIAARHRRMAAR